MVSAAIHNHFGMLFLLLFCCCCATHGDLLPPPPVAGNNGPVDTSTVPVRTKPAAAGSSQTAASSDDSETSAVNNGDTTEESPDPENDAYREVRKVYFQQIVNGEFSTNDLIEVYQKILSEGKHKQLPDLTTFAKDASPPSSAGATAAAAVDEPIVEYPVEEHKLYTSAIRQMHKGRKEWFAALKTFTSLIDKHPLAESEIVWMLLLMQPTDKSLELTRLHMQEWSPAREPGGHSLLGYMYATGIGQNVSQARAVLHYTMGALADEPISLMALGYRFWSGVSVPASCERALHFYKRVAVKVAAKISFSGGGQTHRMRLLDEAENTGTGGGSYDRDLIEYYQMMAEKGDINSQIGLGQLHYQGGRGLPQDLHKALQYFTPAANAGNAVALAFLGKIYLEGSEDVEANNETAFKYFTKAAELGNPVGQSGLGVMYLQGKGVERDSAKAFNYFTQSAEQGWVDGQLQLGNMYFSGQGVKRDFKQATKYFNLASQSGHVLAYYNLGQMHAMGLGVIRSCPMAVEFFKNVAERGRWSERLMSAHQDYKAYRVDEAFRKYLLAGEMGYETGQSNAAYLLDRGEVTMFANRTEQLVRALQLWGRAASQGYSAAQVKMGDYHYYGLGTHIDYDAAASHYRTASDQQHSAQAMFNLAYMHEQGLGMQKDWHLSKRYYDMAATTSTDAKVPVALALLKLSLVSNLEYMKESPFQLFVDLGENVASNWDLYLITIVTLLIGFLIYVRRPPLHAEQERGGAQPAAAVPAVPAEAAAPAGAANVADAAAAAPLLGGGDVN